MTFLPELREYCAVMILTAYDSIDQAVNAVKAGATEFLVKPVSPQNLELTLARFFETVALKRDLAFWQAQAQSATQVDLVGESAEMAEVRRLVSIFAAADTPVLICGENGVSLRFDHQPTLDEIRDIYLRLLLDKFAGNRKQVAEALGVSKRNTYRMLKKLDG
ncbi:hypothetical protein [Profundibacter sp.]